MQNSLSQSILFDTGFPTHLTEVLNNISLATSNIDLNCFNLLARISDDAPGTGLPATSGIKQFINAKPKPKPTNKNKTQATHRFHRPLAKTLC